MSSSLACQTSVSSSSSFGEKRFGADSIKEGKEKKRSIIRNVIPIVSKLETKGCVKIVRFLKKFRHCY